MKFKTRYENRKKYFKHQQHINDLPNELSKIKISNKEPIIKWNTLGQYQPYNINTKQRLICLNEKLQIVIYERSTIQAYRSN